MKQLDYSIYSGGEVKVVVPEGFPSYINMNIKDSNDFFALAMTVDAIRRRNGTRTPIYLTLPYVPYARQDRVCGEGEALSIAVFARLLNSLDLTQVVINDPHSDVTPALINNVVVVPQKDCFNALCSDIKDYAIVSPDAGARKKSYDVASVAGVLVVEAEKKRGKDGRISNTIIYDELPDVERFVVVDDICDYGGTFISLAKVLRTKTDKPLVLYVTHGIFAAGYDELLEYYEEIRCFNNMLDGQQVIKKV
jgi:ribose-phosphate pyrophosphokinase